MGLRSMLFPFVIALGCASSQSASSTSTTSGLSESDCERLAEHYVGIVTQGAVLSDGGEVQIVKLKQKLQAQCLTKLTHEDHRCMTAATDLPGLRACPGKAKLTYPSRYTIEH